MASSVPPEDELIEVALDVLAAEAVEHALRPSLEVRENPMDPVQQLVRFASGDDHPRAGLCESLGHGAADAPGAADHDGHAPVQVEDVLCQGGFLRVLRVGLQFSRGAKRTRVTPSMSS